MPRRSEKIANKKIASVTTIVNSILKKTNNHRQKDRHHHKHIRFLPDNELCKIRTIETSPKRHLKAVPPLTKSFTRRLNRHDVMLNPFIFREARKQLGFKPSVDLFASADHHQLKIF